MSEIAPLIEVAREVGYPGLLIVMLIGTTVWLSNQILKIRQQLSDLAISKTRGEVDELRRAIEVFEKLKGTDFKDEELRALKLRLFKLDPEPDFEFRHYVKEPSFLHPHPGDSIGDLLTTSSFLLLGGVVAGFAGTAVATAALFGIYNAVPTGALGAIIFIPLGLIIILMWYGLCARPVGSTLLSFAKSIAGILGRIFTKSKFGHKAIDWSET